MRPLCWALSFLACCASLRAELKPEEVAVLAMAESPESLEVAEHYLAARKIPAGHLLKLPGKPQAEIERAAWDETYAPAVRRWLTEQQLVGQIRCLVTVYDVPLKIGARATNSPALQAHLAGLEQQRLLRLERAANILTALDQLAATAEVAPREALPPETKAADVAAQFDAAIQAARMRIMAAPNADAAGALDRLALAGLGLSRVAGLRARAAESVQLDLPSARALGNLVGQVQGLRDGLGLLDALPESLPRDLHMARGFDALEGTLGCLVWLERYTALLKGHETYSSFDSELSLLLCPEYPLVRWLPNRLNWRVEGQADPRELGQVLMVSRLEAPTVALTKGLVDTALKIEAEGLSGKFYLDARGIAFDRASGQRGSYGDYDEALRELHDLLKKYGDPVTILDDQPELFAEGTCPEAALYCGWYSLANYVDAFTWQPGAVAYHIASSEAVTLRDPASNVWCKKMLEKGVCATLGPVYEPYLAAFPRPDEFFPLLMTGKLTLAETYYRTLPFNSWVMVLVGDPLYRPFLKQAAFVGDDYSPELKRLLQEP